MNIGKVIQRVFQRRDYLALAVRSFVLFALACSCCLDHVQGSSPCGGGPFAAISVRELTRVARTPEAKSLFNVTYLRGFCLFTDAKGLNLVLLAQKEPKRPSLRLDDFVVAWLNVSLETQRPACSIDPLPETLRKLESLDRQFDAETDPARCDSIIEKWLATARSPQQVHVWGVDRRTNFARVMVEADYLVKDFSQGHRKFAQLVGTFDERVESARKSLAEGKPAFGPSRRVSRFWFNAGEPTVYHRVGRDLFFLGPCPVVLLTEEEAITPGGTLVGRGRPEPFAQRFAESFTTHFDQISQDYPIFRELENLYRAVAVAEILRQLDRKDVRELLNALAREATIEKVDVPTTLPGKARSVKLEQRTPVEGGYLEARSWFLVSGGVSVDVRVKEKHYVQVPDALVLEFHEAIVTSQPTPSSVIWFPGKAPSLCP